jgi:hypothetical protein
MLTDENEVLFRQIHPTFIQDGQPSSQPFAPTPKDANRLSVDRSSLTTAADSHALFTGNGHASEAVYGVSVGEFGQADLPCHSEPLPATETEPENPAHAYADFAAHALNQQKNRAKRLKQHAIARGRMHPVGE